MKAFMKRLWARIKVRLEERREDLAVKRAEGLQQKKHNKLKFKTNGIFTWSDYKNPGFRVLYGFMLLILFLFLLAAIMPAVWLFISSFKNTAELYQVPYILWPAHFDIGKIAEVWNYINFTKYFSNSVIVVVGAVIAAVIFNGVLAYAIAIIKPRGYKIVFAAVMLSYMIPAITSIVPLFKQIVALNLIDSYIPLWFVFGANAFYFVMFKTYFDSIPKALIEAARLDGANDLQIFFLIVAPLSRPIIGVVAILTTTAAWSDFLLPYLVLQNTDMQTVMVKIFSIQSTIATSGDFTPDMLLMLLCISIIPQIVIFAIFQKQITGTSVTSGLKE